LAADGDDVLGSDVGESSTNNDEQGARMTRPRLEVNDAGTRKQGVEVQEATEKTSIQEG
jgi:hypothetical protein